MEIWVIMIFQKYIIIMLSQYEDLNKYEKIYEIRAQKENFLNPI